MVIVMPRSVPRTTPTFLTLEEKMFSGICERVMHAVAMERERRLGGLIAQVQAERLQKRGFFSKLFRGPVETQKVRDELLGANPLDDDRWFQLNMELKMYDLAAKRVLFNANWVSGSVQVPQSEWALVLRAYHKYVQ